MNLPNDARALPLVTRLAMAFSGFAVMGVGITMLVRSELGLGPWDVLHQGLGRHLDLDLGIVGIGLGVVILVLWWPLRQRPTVGTFLNVACIGLVIHALLPHTSDAHAMWLRVALLASGILLLALGQGLYLAPDLGAGPRDGLMTGLHRRFGVSIRLARTGIEVAALAAGIVLGGTAGLGTILFALAIGPLVQISLAWFGWQSAAAGELAATPSDAIGMSGE